MIRDAQSLISILCSLCCPKKHSVATKTLVLIEIFQFIVLFFLLSDLLLVLLEVSSCSTELFLFVESQMPGQYLYFTNVTQIFLFDKLELNPLVVELYTILCDQNWRNSIQFFKNLLAFVKAGAAKELNNKSNINKITKQ